MSSTVKQGAAQVARVDSTSSHETRAIRFPRGFMWGASTASHQVEGGNRWNDWWELEQTGRLPHRSGEACRHFDLYPRDFDLAHDLGQNAHRFSIEWSRIEPSEGVWNVGALEHYASVVKSLRDRGIEPVVTLHHFTNPAWFARRGGWVRPHSIRLFRRYVDVVARRLSKDVRFWITVNEPTVYAKRAFVTGDWPPCRPNSWREACLALTNLCRAHAAAYPVLHGHRPDAMVGFAHNAPYVVPCDPRRSLDRVSAYLRDFVLNRICFHLMGRSARRVLDFIGVNYYTRQVVRSRLHGLALAFGTECREDHHTESRSFNSVGWEIYPDGLSQTLRRFSRWGVPLIMTENGIATSDEQERSEFLVRHVEALARSIKDGIDVRGYFYWTLFDNFEWTEGFSARFGLAAVDFPDQTRLPRPAAHVFASICRSNQVSLVSQADESRTTRRECPCIDPIEGMLGKVETRSIANEYAESPSACRVGTRARSSK